MALFRKKRNMKKRNPLKKETVKISGGNKLSKSKIQRNIQEIKIVELKSQSILSL